MHRPHPLHFSESILIVGIIEYFRYFNGQSQIGYFKGLAAGFSILYINSMKNNKGFGFIEILIVIAVLGIAGIFAFKMYMGNTQIAAREGAIQPQKAKELEGRVFMGSVVNAEKLYNAANGKYFYTGWSSASAELGISASGNQYFKEFAVEKTKTGGFMVKVRGSGELEGIELISDAM